MMDVPNIGRKQQYRKRINLMFSWHAEAAEDPRHPSSHYDLAKAAAAGSTPVIVALHPGAGRALLPLLPLLPLLRRLRRLRLVLMLHLSRGARRHRRVLLVLLLWLLVRRWLLELVLHHA
jgi:hypothetical protein